MAAENLARMLRLVTNFSESQGPLSLWGAVKGVDFECLLAMAGSGANRRPGCQLADASPTLVEAESGQPEEVC